MVNDSAVVVFDDERVVANAGLMLPALLAGRLRIEALVDQTVDLGDRPGAAHRLLRPDSGFWNNKIFARLQSAGWTYSIGVRQQKHIKAAIAQIPEPDWQALEDYPEGGEAQIAQTMLGAQRLVVRRTRLVGEQAQLFADWRHFAFLTNRTDDIQVAHFGQASSWPTPRGR